MELQDTIIIQAPREKVGEFFKEPQKVVDCVPGIQDAKIDGNNFKAKIKIKVGAISGTFKVEGSIKETKPNEEYEVTLKGGSLGNKFDAKAIVTLTDAENNATQLSYKADAKLGGLLAALGQSMLAKVTKDILTQLFDCAKQKITG
jgi:carbon monoxide dehydrogenase subunit G